MAKPKAAAFDLTCPSCRAILTIDPEVKAVLQHSPPPRTGPASSLDKAMEALRGEQGRREARFREAAEAEKSKEQVLTRKFEAGLKRAKDSPPPGPRPIDLD
ncbi:MAG TPA: hypothetical protein VGW35_17555 [Methylomirabilota bacterium]|jgi:hypothetical protein|nr:hypothetical protein [Methylomirabilota bacterium]